MARREELLWQSWGKGIAQRRKNLGLSQAGLGDRLGVAQGTVSKWENGTLAPDDAMKMRLAELFGRTLDELFGWPPFLPPEHDTQAVA